MKDLDNSTDTLARVLILFVSPLRGVQPYCTQTDQKLNGVLPVMCAIGLRGQQSMIFQICMTSTLVLKFIF